MIIKLLLLLPSIPSLSCLDNTGASKDFWMILKAPQIANIPPIPGKSYIYLDELNLGYKFSNQPLNISSAMVSTLTQINSDSTISFLAYNDCPAPSCPNYNFGNGHMKGLLAYTSSQAIFIIHSFPQFPNISSSYKSNKKLVTPDFDPSQSIYGQDMFCFSLKTSDLFSIAGMMSIGLPNVYSHRINIQNANISLLIANKSISAAKFYAGFSFTTLNGYQFKYFSKAGSSGLDIFESVISPFYNDGLMCETWGRPWDPDFCPPSYKYKNLNIDEVSFGTYWWSSYYDHSKWAIGLTNNLVCFCDMNRMDDQPFRGGGAVCILDTKLYGYYKSIATKYDSC